MFFSSSRIQFSFLLVAVICFYDWSNSFQFAYNSINLLLFSSRGTKMDERKGEDENPFATVRPPLDFIASSLSQEYEEVFYSWRIQERWNE
jgi:hypothetical protein